MRGENRSTRGKTSHSRVENQQTQSTFDAECGNRTRATLVEGKCSHHNANPATKTKTKTDMMLLVDANLTPPGVPQGQTCAQSFMNGFWARKAFGTFKKRAPVLTMGQCPVTNNEVQTEMIVRPGTI